MKILTKKRERENINNKNIHDDGRRRIKTENYFFFVPFGLKLIFTVSEEWEESWRFYSFCTQKGIVGESRDWHGERALGCQMNTAPFSLSPSAPMILNVNEGIKFCFYFISTSFLFFLFAAPEPGAVVVCFPTSLSCSLTLSLTRRIKMK